MNYVCSIPIHWPLKTVVLNEKNSFKQIFKIMSTKQFEVNVSRHWNIYEIHWLGYKQRVCRHKDTVPLHLRLSRVSTMLTPVYLRMCLPFRRRSWREFRTVYHWKEHIPIAWGGQEDRKEHQQNARVPRPRLNPQRINDPAHRNDRLIICISPCCPSTIAYVSCYVFVMPCL